MSMQFNTPSSASGDIENDDPMPDFIVIDASVWVSRLVQKDVFHRAVKAWMEKQRSEGVIFLSPALLLSEVTGAISRSTGEPHSARNATDSLIHLPGLRLVAMDLPLVQEATRLAADLGVRGADSFYVAVAARLNLPLFTLDEDQKTRADSVIAVYTLDKPR